MQIVNGDRNRQLRKDEGTLFRKMNPQGSLARKLKNVLQSHAPLRWGGVVGIPWPIDIMGLSAGSHATSAKKGNWGKGKRQGPGAKDLPEGRTLMMISALPIIRRIF